MTEHLFKNKYRIAPARLRGWDYGSSGLYFITICTKEKVPYFGEFDELVVNEHVSLRSTGIGLVAHEYWHEIPKHFPFVELDAFILMPDHLHGILFINKPDKVDWQTSQAGKQSQNLASIIRGYKASVKRYANSNAIDFQWQASYYDRVIRDQREYQNIAQYIYDNPQRWHDKTANTTF